jgi:replicative DNA helicase Mcm
MEETEPTTVTEINRESPEYRQWVTDIHNRDKVCQICGGTKHLEAHHIYGYKNNPELRTDRGNGVLLCTFCHGKFHSYYGKGVTPADLVKFIFEFKGL